MNTKTKKFLNGLGKSVPAGDPDALGRLLAPWLDAPDWIDRYRKYRHNVLKEFDYDGEPPLDELNVSAGDLDFTEVAESFNLAEQVTAANYKGWYHVQWIYGEDQEGFEAAMDIWLAAVEHDGELRVGYMEFGEGD